jgi:hypothetical protein
MIVAPFNLATSCGQIEKQGKGGSERAPQEMYGHTEQSNGLTERSAASTVSILAFKYAFLVFLLVRYIGCADEEVAR